MLFLSRLLGKRSGASSRAEPEMYNGYRIYPEPRSEAGGYRVCAQVEKEIDGVSKSYLLIRADVCSSMNEAAAVSLAKAKQVINERGDAIFN